MILRPPISPRADTLCPTPTLFRSRPGLAAHEVAFRLRLAAGALGDHETHQAAHVVGSLFAQDAHARRPFARERLERSEEHTSELQSLMRNSYAVFCLKKKTNILIHCALTNPLKQLQHTTPS